MYKLASMLILIVSGLALSTLGLAAPSSWGSNIHHEAKKCRDNYRPECDFICQECHTPPYNKPSAVWKSRFYLEGDKQLCGRCHTEKNNSNKSDYLLYRHSGNHPNNVFYEPWRRPGAGLRYYPVGPKLICGPAGMDPCKIMCSTCHDPMSDTRNLHRINNAGSLLCRSCHQFH